MRKLIIICAWSMLNGCCCNSECPANEEVDGNFSCNCTCIPGTHRNTATGICESDSPTGSGPDDYVEAIFEYSLSGDSIFFEATAINHQFYTGAGLDSIVVSGTDNNLLSMYLVIYADDLGAITPNSVFFLSDQRTTGTFWVQHTNTAEALNPFIPQGGVGTITIVDLDVTAETIHCAFDAVLSGDSQLYLSYGECEFY